MKDPDTLKVGLAQISPVWLNKGQTMEKIESYIKDAGKSGCNLVVFGEGLLPGYPFWLSLTNGSSFDNKMQKEIHSHYVQNAIVIEKGELNSIRTLAKEHNIAIYLGIIERAQDRGGHSLYCSLVYMNENGEIKSVHRKLQPTYEERLAWSQGDGHGLTVHPIKKFHIGGLNCWENWMPLPRTALYGQGENIHVAVWPGTNKNTEEITRFIAKESRSFVLSASGILTKKDIPIDFPYRDEILSVSPKVLANGGSCIAGPDGEWIIPPRTDGEQLITSTININRIFEERQNFDPSGHYSRPDVTQLFVNKERQSIIKKKRTNES